MLGRIILDTLDAIELTVVARILVSDFLVFFSQNVTTLVSGSSVVLTEHPCDTMRMR